MKKIGSFLLIIFLLVLCGCNNKSIDKKEKIEKLGIKEVKADGLEITGIKYDRTDKTIEVIIKNNRDSDIDLKNLTIYLLNNENQIVTKKSHFESKIIKSNESYNILIYLDEKGVNYDNVSNIIFTYEQ